MKYYIQFLETKLDGNLDELLGTDGIYPIDGRLSLDNMKAQGIKRAKQLSGIKAIDGLRVMRGPIRSAVCLAALDFTHPTFKL